MATELKTNGTAAEYSPTKMEMQNGRGSEEKYTKVDKEGEEERVPLKESVDVEKAVPVATIDEDDQDVKDSVSLKSGKKEKKKKEKKKEKKSPLKGEKTFPSFRKKYQLIFLSFQVFCPLFVATNCN